MKIRILTPTPFAGVVLPPDCVPDLPESIARALVQDGQADAHPDAVAYAEANGVACPDLPAFEPDPEPVPAKKAKSVPQTEPAADA